LGRVTIGIEVSELILASAPRVTPRRHCPAPSARNLSSVIGTAGTILLHALAIPSLVFGVLAHAPHPKDPEGVGTLSTASPAEALVLITLADNAKPDADPLGGAPSLKFQLEKIRLNARMLPSMSLEAADDLPVDAPATALCSANHLMRVRMMS
jgi:hypothetical protein